MRLNSTAIVSPEDQRPTFVELFFDLVFVFAVTQVVSLLHHGLEWEYIGQAVLVFWLVWWAWTQFTWVLNAADTTHATVELLTLVATGFAFLMAVSLPDAFEDRAIWFAVPYVLVRTIGLALHLWVTWGNPSQRAAVREFAIFSIGGLIAVLIGALVGGTLQYIFWAVTIVADVIAAARSAQSDSWNLHPEHFAERHGLFVIIALGETLIVAAGGVTGVEWTTDLRVVAFLGVAITCALWWSYFTRVKPAVDHAFEHCTGSVQSTLGRDAYSLLHFPMLCGVVAYAVALDESVHHASDPLSLEMRAALAASMVLFVGGMALALWRATKQILIPRLALVAITGLAVLLISGVAPTVTLVIFLIGLVAVIAVEQSTIRPVGEAHP